MFRKLFLSAFVISGCSTLDPLNGNPFADDSPTPLSDKFDNIDEYDVTIDVTDPYPGCSFTVETMNDDVEMANTLNFRVSEESPRGDVQIGTSEVLRLEFVAEHPECPNLLVTGFTITAYWTDNAGSGWYPSWIGMRIDDELVEGTMFSLQPSKLGGYAGMNEPIVVDPKAKLAKTVSIEATMDGASEELHDSITFGLYASSLGVYDGLNDPETLYFRTLYGNTLVFY